VHADRPVGLAAAAEQATQREMQLDGLVVDLDRLDEGVDGLVGLLVEQEVEAGQVGARQRPRLLDHMLDVDAGGQPAQHEKQRKRQQPPEFEFHGVSRSPADRAMGQGNWLRVRRRSRPFAQMADLAMLAIERGEVAVTPISTPRTTNNRITSTRGTCHWVPKKKRRTTTSSFLTANPKSSRNRNSRKIQISRRMPEIIPDVTKKEGGFRRLLIEPMATGGRPDGTQPIMSTLPQLLAGLEVRNVLLRHLHLFAGLGIAPHAGRTVIQGKAAKTADLDAITPRQGVGHRIENHLYRELGVLRDQLGKRSASRAMSSDLVMPEPLTSAR
jgi:hypothetical protein